MGFRLKMLLAVVFNIMPVLVGLVKVGRADLQSLEAQLNPAGAAYEINQDEQGILWISDYDAGEIWGVEPASGANRVYTVGGAPSDARRVGDYLWWADGLTNRLGRLSTSTGAYALWQVSGSDGFYGTGVDAQNRLWVNDNSYPFVYRLDPEVGELCTYTLPLDGMSSYLLLKDGYVWLGDWVNSRLLRLDSTSHTLTWWTLPVDSYPFGMALDGQAAMWYTDSGNNELGRLDPVANTLRRYELPVGSLPQMLYVAGSYVWYTEHSQASIGRLTPQAASYEAYTPDQGSVIVTPNCDSISPASSGTLTASTGMLSWGNASYANLIDSGGWMAYKLPDYAWPWGITADEALWFVDSGRQVLGKIAISVQVTACKMKDTDGELTNIDDQTPVEGWRIYLTIDGVRQGEGQLTSAAGCTTWKKLDPGVQYGVAEDMPDGWTALTPTENNFGIVIEGQFYNYTFVNRQDSSEVFLPLVIR